MERPYIACNFFLKVTKILRRVQNLFEKER
mgnify:CR=1 FL=1